MYCYSNHICLWFILYTTWSITLFDIQPFKLSICVHRSRSQHRQPDGARRSQTPTPHVVGTSRTRLWEVRVRWCSRLVQLLSEYVPAQRREGQKHSQASGGFSLVKNDDFRLYCVLVTPSAIGVLATFNWKSMKRPQKPYKVPRGRTHTVHRHSSSSSNWHCCWTRKRKVIMEREKERERERERDL